jgi:hypothetical protein
LDDAKGFEFVNLGEGDNLAVSRPSLECAALTTIHEYSAKAVRLSMGLAPTARLSAV